MPDPNNGRRDGAPPSHIHIEKKKVNWIAWLLLAAGILAALFALSRCDREEDHPTDEAAPPASNEVVAATPDAGKSTVLASSAALGGYLAGTEATPRRFTFEKLNFETAKSVVRPEDTDEVTAVASTLKQYPTSQVRIAGYADSRGATQDNLALGKARAEAVKAALVAQGIAAERIATASGGETDPVESNATSSGQAENRRTEIVVIKR